MGDDKQVQDFAESARDRQKYLRAALCEFVSIEDAAESDV
jgi:hypothetical protein